MNDDNFRVIKGRSDDSDLYENIKWERVDKDEKVISLYPSTFKAAISERRLRLMVEKLRKMPGITITYDAFAEEDKIRDKKYEELKEMLSDNDKVVVIDPNRFNK